VTLGQRQGDNVVITQGVAAGEKRHRGRPDDRSPEQQGGVWIPPALDLQGRWANAPASAKVMGTAGSMNLSEPFIRRPVMTAVLTISAIVFGVLAYFALPVNGPACCRLSRSSKSNVGYPGATPEDDGEQRGHPASSVSSCRSPALSGW